MPQPINRLITVHSYDFSDKGRAIKGLVVCWLLLDLISTSGRQSIASHYKQMVLQESLEIKGESRPNQVIGNNSKDPIPSILYKRFLTKATKANRINITKKMFFFYLLNDNNNLFKELTKLKCFFSAISWLSVGTFLLFDRDIEFLRVSLKLYFFSRSASPPLK